MKNKLQSSVIYYANIIYMIANYLIRVNDIQFEYYFDIRLNKFELKIIIFDLVNMTFFFALLKKCEKKINAIEERTIVY